MKPISKETIEHADDFIFHLSDNQLKEWIDENDKLPSSKSICLQT